MKINPIVQENRITLGQEIILQEDKLTLNYAKEIAISDPLWGSVGPDYFS